MLNYLLSYLKREKLSNFFHETPILMTSRDKNDCTETLEQFQLLPSSLELYLVQVLPQNKQNKRALSKNTS